MYWKYEIWYYSQLTLEELHCSGILYADNYMEAQSKIAKMYIADSIDCEKVILECDTEDFSCYELTEEKIN